VAPFRRPFVDPSGDGFVRIGDILLIISFLRSQSPPGSPEGEGESESFDASQYAPITVAPQATSAAEDEPWTEAAIVSPALEDAAPPAASEDDSDDALADEDDADEFDDFLSAIAEDVAGQWSEV
jgi:hypothetical protein